MLLDDYQTAARSTRLKNVGHRIIYPTLGLTGEAGEVAELVKKHLRGRELDEHEMALEMGDVLWYLAALADDIGIPLSVIAALNLEKLSKRKREGEIAWRNQADGSHDEAQE